MKRTPIAFPPIVSLLSKQYRILSIRTWKEYLYACLMDRLIKSIETVTCSALLRPTTSTNPEPSNTSFPNMEITTSAGDGESVTDTGSIYVSPPHIDESTSSINEDEWLILYQHKAILWPSTAPNWKEGNILYFSHLGTLQVLRPCGIYNDRLILQVRFISPRREGVVYLGLNKDSSVAWRRRVPLYFMGIRYSLFFSSMKRILV